MRTPQILTAILTALVVSQSVASEVNSASLNLSAYVLHLSLHNANLFALELNLRRDQCVHPKS